MLAEDQERKRQTPTWTMDFWIEKLSCVIIDRLDINTWTDFPVKDFSVLNGHLSQPNHLIIPLKGHVSETLKDPTRGQVHF